MIQFDRYGIPPPVIGEDFERLCWDLWRSIWNDPATQMNGRRGQKQRGVDIFGKPANAKGWAAIQCKAKDIRRNSKLTFDEIQAEVEQAKLFLPRLDQLTIATTCLSDVALQESVRQLNDDLCSQGLFSVAVLGWEEICRRLSDFPAVVERHYPACAQRRLTEGIQTLSSTFAGSISNFLAEYLGSRGVTIPFGGRSSTMQELTDWVESDEAFPYLLLTAPAGRGKSALLAQWIAGQSIRSDLHVVYFPVSIRFRTNLKSVFFPSLAARLAHIHGETPPSLADLPSEAGLGLVCDLLTRPTPDGKPLLLVIDGLDEAADFSPGPSLIPLAPWQGLRVIVAVRSQIGERDGSAWLAELGWANLDLAQTIGLKPLSAAGVADVLQNMGNPLDTLGKRAEVVQALYKLTRGDPLLVRLYVDDLRRRAEIAPHLSVEDLHAFRPGFSGYMDRWWKEQRSLWRERGQEAMANEETMVRSVLAILTSTVGPIMLADLVQLLSGRKALSRNALRDCLEPLARFVIGDGISQGYTFSHPRMSEYFRDEELTADEVATAGNQLREWCERSLTAVRSATLPPESVPGYVVQYYGAHLEAGGGSSDQLVGLIDECWLAAWRYRDRTLIGFLNDVDRGFNAYRQAIRARIVESDCLISYGPLFRATLSHASVNSMAGNIPADLLALLVKERIWSATQGLAYARRMGNDWGLIDALITLAPLLPEAVLVECIDAIGLVADEDARLEALRGIVGAIPTEMMDHVVAVAAGFEGDAAKADVIAALSGRLDAATSRSAFSLSTKMTDEESLATSLIALGRTLPEPYLKAAVEVALDLPDEEMRGDVLSCLVSRLTENSDTYKRALQSAVEIGDDYERLRLLAGFVQAAHKDDLVKIISSILDSSDPAIREAAIVRCARSRPQETLTILREHAHELLQESDQILVAAASSLTPKDREDLARRLLERSDDDDALHLLASLIPLLSKDGLALVGKAADDPERSGHDRHLMTIALLPYLPKPDRDGRIAAALAAANELTSEWERCETIRDLIPFACEGLVDQAVAAIDAVESIESRCRLLDDVSSDLSAEQYGVIVSRYVEVRGKRNITLQELISLLPGLDEIYLLNVIRSDRYNHDDILYIIELSQKHLDNAGFKLLVSEVTTCCKTSQGFVPFCAAHAAALPPDLLDAFVTRISQLEDRRSRVEYTVAIAPQVSLEIRLPLLLGLLQSLQKVSDAEATLASQFRLAPYLSPPKLAALLSKIDQISDSDAKLESFRALVGHLPASVHPHALSVALRLEKSHQRAEALHDLATRQAGSDREQTLAAMRETLTASDLVENLVRLSEQGDVALADEALSQVRDLEDPLRQALALARLARDGIVKLDAAAVIAGEIKDPIMSGSLALHLARTYPMTEDELQLLFSSANPYTQVALILDDKLKMLPSDMIELPLASLTFGADDEVKAEAMSLFLEYLSVEHIESLFQMAMSIEDKWLNGIALAFLANHFDEAWLSTLLANLSSQEDLVLRTVSLRIVECLATLDHDLPCDIARHELALLLAAMPHSHRAPLNIQAWLKQIFLRITRRMTERVSLAFEKYIFDASRALSGVTFEFTDELQRNLQSLIFEKGPGSLGSKSFAGALSGLSFGITPFLEELDSTSRRRFGDHGDREHADPATSADLAEEETSSVGPLDQFDAALKAMLCAKRVNRLAAVNSLVSVVPSLQAAGGGAAGDDLVDSIDEITRWFP